MAPLDLSRSEFFVRSTTENDDSTVLIVDHIAQLQQERELSPNLRGAYTRTMKASDDEFSKEWFIDDQVQR